MNAAFWGSIDLFGLREVPALDAGALQQPAPGVIRQTPRPRRFDAPGISLAICDPRVCVHASGSLLALVHGAPRFADSTLQAHAVQHGAASGWRELYLRHGEQSFGRVSGRYAAVIVDVRERKVMLATDRFSAHPVCYAQAGTHLHFSDRAVAVPGAQARALDPQALFDYFYFHVIPSPRTIFDGVAKLEAAHALIVEAGAQRVLRYWSPSPATVVRPFAELREEFITLVRASVAVETADGNTACFLSGGTDSSTIAGMIRAVTGQPAQTYSIGFDAAGFDEMAYAKIAARHFGAQHHAYYVKPDDIVAALPEVASAFDQPFGNSSALPAYCCSRLARADGHFKLLAGDGGDELFGGNSRYAKQRVFELYQAAPEALRLGLAPFSAPWARSLPLVRKAARYVEQARVPLPDRLETYNLIEMLGSRRIFTPAFLAQVNPGEPLLRQRATYAESAGAAMIDRLLQYDWKYTLADNDLVKVRGATQLAGIEAGYPFLADDLVDFSLRLAPALKLRGLRLRYFFKQALKGFLPEAILHKPKHGFGLPFGAWLVQHPALQSLATGALARLATRGLLRHDFLAELSTRRLQEHAGYYGEMVWVLATLELWLSRHAPGFRVAT